LIYNGSIIIGKTKSSTKKAKAKKDIAYKIVIQKETKIKSELKSIICKKRIYLKA